MSIKTMSIKTKFAAFALAAMTLTAGVAATGQEAHAGFKGKGVAFGVGIATGALIGAAAASHYGPHYVHYSPRRCRWERQYDVYGYYIGRARVCSYPVY